MNRKNHNGLVIVGGGGFVPWRSRPPSSSFAKPNNFKSTLKIERKNV
jgi:hypothetical protein